MKSLALDPGKASKELETVEKELAAIGKEAAADKESPQSNEGKERKEGLGESTSILEDLSIDTSKIVKNIVNKEGMLSSVNQQEERLKSAENDRGKLRTINNVLNLLLNTLGVREDDYENLSAISKIKVVREIIRRNANLTVRSSANTNSTPSLVPAKSAVLSSTTGINQLMQVISVHLPGDVNKQVRELVISYTTTACDFEYCQNSNKEPALLQELDSSYSVSMFLEDRHIQVLARFEYVRLTGQSLSASEGDFNTYILYDQSLVEANPEALVENNSQGIQAGVGSAIGGRPAFFGVSNYRHWAITALLPSGNNGEVSIYYMNSAYGAGAERYFGCKAVGLTLCQNVVNQVNARSLRDGKARPKVIAEHLCLEPSQQIENNCGAVAGFNIAGIAAWYRARRLNQTQDTIERFLGRLEYNTVLATRNAQKFESIVRARFIGIRTTARNTTLALSSVTVTGVEQVTREVMDGAYYKTVQDLIRQDKEAVEIMDIGESDELSKDFDIAQQIALFEYYEWLKVEIKSSKSEQSKTETKRKVEDEASLVVQSDRRNALVSLYTKLTKVIEYTGLVVESDSWATGYGINQCLERLLGDDVHIIDPDTSSVASPVAINYNKALEGAFNYIKMIGGYYTGGEFIRNGFIHKDGGTLKKPIVMIWDTFSIKVISSKATTAIKENHWQTCVILPKNYITPLGIELNNETEMVFFIDSLYEDRTIPKNFKRLLTTSFKYGFSDGSKIFTHKIGGMFPRARFVNCVNVKQQLQGYDSGWWALYNALMLVLTGSEVFLQQFKERSRNPSYASYLPAKNIKDISLKALIYGSISFI